MAFQLTHRKFSLKEHHSVKALNFIFQFINEELSRCVQTHLLHAEWHIRPLLGLSSRHPCPGLFPTSTAVPRPSRTTIACFS